MWKFYRAVKKHEYGRCQAHPTYKILGIFINQEACRAMLEWGRPLRKIPVNERRRAQHFDLEPRHLSGYWADCYEATSHLKDHKKWLEVVNNCINLQRVSKTPRAAWHWRHVKDCFSTDVQSMVETMEIILSL